LILIGAARRVLRKGSMENHLMKVRRTRIVNFRVTEEEYERLRDASHALGINGISGYARQATLYLAERNGSGDAGHHAATAEDVFIASLTELKTRVAELETKVERLIGPTERMRETCA
jgi:hypothetical protein